jgi:hypothetical protein
MRDFVNNYSLLRLRRPQLILLCQLLTTVAVLGWVPGNSAKLLIMVVVWGLGFRRLAAAELLMMAGVNLLFALINSAALARGIFRFDHPDLLGMPVYEYVMWGYYTLHTIRLLGGEPAPDRLIVASAAAVVFVLPFATIADPALLLLTSAGLLAGCLAIFHQRMDLFYAGYMAALGALVEYVGVGTGQWHYPGQHYAGVPLWFLTMWAGVGLFTRRLLLPVLRGADANRSGTGPARP